MKKLLFALLISLPLMSFSKGLTDGAKDAPTVSIKPCMVLIGQDTYMNANTVTTIRLEKYDAGNVRYRFGYQEIVITYENTSEALKGVERVLKQIEEKCN